MNLVQGQDAREKRPKVRAFVLGAILLLAILGVFALICCERTQTRKPSMPSHTATWKEVQTVLDTAMRSREYRKGGELLASRAAVRPGNLDDLCAVSLREVIDFLLSLTPEQVEVMKRREPLPFTKLSPDQQKVLIGFSLSAGSQVCVRARDSSIRVVSFLKDDGKTWGHMIEWTVPSTSGRGFSGWCTSIDSRY